MNPQEIANAIIQQLGGFGKLRAMIGAHSYLVADTGVSFQFKGCRKAKKCIIRLLPDDTYEMQIGKMNMKTFDWKELYNETGLYCDMLKPEFEKATGLYLSL